jgi:hypothetical protein
LNRDSLERSVRRSNGCYLLNTPCHVNPRRVDCDALLVPKMEPCRYMSSYRIGRRSKFTTIPNAIIEDKSLSPVARLVLIWTLSRPEGWVFHQSHVGSVLGMGERQVAKAFRDLIEAGYIRREGQTRTKGKWGPANYTVFEETGKSTTRSVRNQKVPYCSNGGAVTASLTNTDRPRVSNSRPRRTAIPQNIQLTAPMMAAAEASGWDLDRQVKEFKRFIQWNTDNEVRSANWPAAWENWVDRGNQFTRRSSKPGRVLSATATMAMQWAGRNTTTYHEANR